MSDGKPEGAQGAQGAPGAIEGGNTPQSTEGAGKANVGDIQQKLDTALAENAALKVLTQAYLPEGVSVKDELGFVTADGKYRKPAAAVPATPAMPATPAPTAPSDGRSLALEGLYRLGYLRSPNANKS